MFCDSLAMIPILFTALERPYCMVENAVLVDKFNKDRQRNLALEKFWPVRSCWTRVITSMLGECVTNLVRYDRYMRKWSPFCLGLDDLQYKAFTTKEMANRIALPLESGGLGAKDRTVEHKRHEEHLPSGAALQ